MNRSTFLKTLALGAAGLLVPTVKPKRKGRVRVITACEALYVSPPIVKLFKFECEGGDIGRLVFFTDGNARSEIILDRFKASLVETGVDHRTQTKCRVRMSADGHYFSMPCGLPGIGEREKGDFTMFSGTGEQVVKDIAWNAAILLFFAEQNYNDMERLKNLLAAAKKPINPAIFSEYMNDEPSSFHSRNPPLLARASHGPSHVLDERNAGDSVPLQSGLRTLRRLS